MEVVRIVDQRRHHVGVERRAPRSRQIQFPKLVLPVAAVVAGIANFAFGLIPLFALMLLFYRDRIDVTLLLIPVVAAVQFVFNLGMTVLLSALNVFYRDIGNLARHVLRLWFYLSPALFALEQLTHATREFPLIQKLLLLNPWATLFSAYRAVIYEGTLPDWGALLEVLLGVDRLPRPHDARVQAPRAVVREGPLMVDVAGRPAEAAPAPLRSDAPVAIDVHDLGVQYILRFTKKTTLNRSFINLFRREPADAFWALRDVTFQVVHGESLAVIGPNGAGKSTLLQVLAGIITPSEGVVDVDGRVSSLLTLGAGFDQDLSGRDNIRLAGAFMGLDPATMRRITPGIVEFADIGPFIDAPIKTYSSGMRARLGFAIATAVDPDILLLDEVLATGDETFRAKSKQRVLELVRGAKGIVLVTHDMNWVTEFCNRAILLETGPDHRGGRPDRGRRHPPRALRAVEGGTQGGAGSGDPGRGRRLAPPGRGTERRCPLSRRRGAPEPIRAAAGRSRACSRAPRRSPSRHDPR